MEIRKHRYLNSSYYNIIKKEIKFMKPISVLRKNNISIATWDGAIPNYTISKGYMNKQQQWVNEKLNCSDVELLRLDKLIQEIKIDKKIKELRNNDNKKD